MTEFITDTEAGLCLEGLGIVEEIPEPTRESSINPVIDKETSPISICLEDSHPVHIAHLEDDLNHPVPKPTRESSINPVIDEETPTIPECAICLEDLHPVHIAHLVDDLNHPVCNHEYHLTCMVFVRTKQCPICRNAFERPLLKYLELVLDPVKGKRSKNKKSSSKLLESVSSSTFSNSSQSSRPSPTAAKRRKPTTPQNQTNITSTNSVGNITTTSSISINRTRFRPSSLAAATSVVEQFYTLQELQTNPLPVGVDTTKLEQYLSASEFCSIFKMDKEMFGRLSKGQKIVLRQRYGLTRASAVKSFTTTQR